MPRLRDFPTRSNSLNAIRLLLAICVIVSHAWPLGGFGDSPRWGGASLGHVAVAGFFAISGWLITQSRLSSELAGYAWRRFLRIYPAFLVALLVVAFGFAPLGSALGAGSYSIADGVRHVLANAKLSISQFAVGGTPAHVPYPDVWNGSLWTLYHEAACYVLVGLMLTLVGRRWFPASLVLAWLGLSVVEVGGPALGFHFGGLTGAFLELAPFFFAGAMLFVLRERVPLHWALGAASAAGLAAVLALGANPVLAAPPIAYLMMWLGAALPLQRVGRRNDISYGMYIYAFPVQQLLVILGMARWGVVPYIGLGIACTVPLAALSWFAVERPAQRLRRAADRFPHVRSRLRLTRRSPEPAR